MDDITTSTSTSTAMWLAMLDHSVALSLLVWTSSNLIKRAIIHNILWFKYLLIPLFLENVSPAAWSYYGSPFPILYIGYDMDIDKFPFEGFLISPSPNLLLSLNLLLVENSSGPFCNTQFLVKLQWKTSYQSTLWCYNLKQKRESKKVILLNTSGQSLR